MSDFGEQIEQLERQYGTSEKKCVPTYVIVGVLIPLVLFFVLYFFKPSFIMKEENGEEIRNTKRMFVTILLITLAAWILMYFYYMSDGFSNISMTCCST